MKIKAVCLCLPQREEYWKELQKQVENIGLDFRPFVVGTNIQDIGFEEALPTLIKWDYGKPEHKLNHYNAFRCHQQIIKESINNDLDYLLMMEDDAYLRQKFTKNTWERINDYLELVNGPVDLLYLGYWWQEDIYPQIEQQKTKAYDLYIDKVIGDIGGLHSVLISKRLFQDILLMSPNNPIDRQFNLRGHNSLNSYMIFPKLTHIRTCFSFCEGSVIERKEMI